LTEIGADQVPQLLVFNKIDALDSEHCPLKMEDQYELDGVLVPRVFLSAQTGQGLSTLRSVLSHIVKTAMPITDVSASDPRDFDREYSHETP
jgi:GTP-binding protein HflX